MKNRLMIGALLIAGVVTALTSTVSATHGYYKTTSGTKPQQPVTAYLGITPPAGTDLTKPWSCRSKLPNDKNCYGAGGYLLDVGDLAVHMINNQWNNPIANFGSKVVLPKTISLKKRDGTLRTSSVFWIWDTGSGDEYHDYNEWVDIYCGDDWSQSPSRNPYTWDNVTTVRNAFQNPASSRWDLEYVIYP